MSIQNNNLVIVIIRTVKITILIFITIIIFFVFKRKTIKLLFWRKKTQGALKVSLLFTAAGLYALLITSMGTHILHSRMHILSKFRSDAKMEIVRSSIYCEPSRSKTQKHCIINCMQVNTAQHWNVRHIVKITPNHIAILCYFNYSPNLK